MGLKKVISTKEIKLSLGREGSRENVRIKNDSVVGMNTSTFVRRGKKKIVTK